MPVWFPPSVDADLWRIHRAQRGRSSTDALIAALADRQEAIVGRAQLLSLGVSSGEIDCRVSGKRLHVAHRGVYVVGRSTPTPAGRRMAAVLAAGADARLAGWSAAAQRGVLPDAGERVDVALPPGRRVEVRGLALRRVPARPGDIELVDGIPTHAVAPMLLDIAAVNGEETLEWAWRQCIFRRLLDPRDVALLLRDRPGAHGAPALRALLRRRAALVGQLRNRFEALMLSIIREAGLPEPLCNEPFEVAPGLVLRPDFRIPQLMLIVEGDGRDGHADVEFLFSDEERDAFYDANGYSTLRYGHWEATRERSRVVGALRAAAGGAPWKIHRAGRGRSSTDRRGASTPGRRT